MTRHEIREAAFLALFQFEFYSDDIENQLELFLIEDMDYPTQVAGELNERLLDLNEHLAEIDGFIDEALENWKIERMNKVDLALLRLCVYEIKYENLDVAVAINEAVELAKEYGTDESGGFVNGVMGRVVRA